MRRVGTFGGAFQGACVGLGCNRGISLIDFSRGSLWGGGRYDNNASKARWFKMRAMTKSCRCVFFSFSYFRGSFSFEFPKLYLA